MGYLRKVHGVTLGNKMRSCEIRKALNVKLQGVSQLLKQSDWAQIQDFK